MHRRRTESALGDRHAQSRLRRNRHMRRVRLEPLGGQHAAGVDALVSDPEVMRFTRVPDPAPSDFARSWIERYEEGRREGRREAFAVHTHGGEFVGLGLAPEINRDAGEVELGYIVSPAARGRGLAREILMLLTDWAFDKIEAQRVYLIINVENVASARVAERCGYTLEGVMRSWHVKQGLRADAGLWSRLPSDPVPR
jgi:RimJ/RimL family protein N-acetyltransferase